MKLWLEACRATTTAAVADVAARAPEASLSASVAKSYVGEMAGRIVQGCVQMHGGIGVTWEHDLHLYLRRVALYRSCSAHRRSTTYGCTTPKKPVGARNDSGSADGIRRRVRRPRPRMVGGQHAAHRPRLSAARTARRRGGVEAGSRPAKAVVRRRIRRNLFPRAYGGLGLDYAYQKAFDQESLRYEMPLILNTPTFTICCATLLDTGSEEQKTQQYQRCCAATRYWCSC